MTGLVHSYKDTGTFYGKTDNLAWLAATRLQVANADDTDIDDTSLDGWFDVGYITGFTASRSIEVADIKTGTAIKTTKSIIKIGEDIELPIQVTHPSYQGLTLNMGNTIAPAFTAPADGQTTVASSTSTTVTVVNSASNLAAGDLIKVTSGNTATYDSYEELVWIKSVSGTTITHSELSQQPIASANFLKVGGVGTASTGAGIKFTFGGAALPRRKVRIVRYGHPNASLILDVFTECIINGVTELEFPENAPMTAGFSFKPLDCGDATNGPLFGYRYIKAYES
tara:strand:- start:9720 stop:10568 length:849 start_codon:yes stop_codon:yes gene_type:complete